MRRFGIAVALPLLALALSGVAEAAAGVGDPAPDFGGTWLNRPSTTLAALRGRVVLVEFMRTT